MGERKFILLLYLPLGVQTTTFVNAFSGVVLPLYLPLGVQTAHTKFWNEKSTSNRGAFLFINVMYLKIKFFREKR